MPFGHKRPKNRRAASSVLPLTSTKRWHNSSAPTTSTTVAGRKSNVNFAPVPSHEEPINPLWKYWGIFLSKVLNPPSEPDDPLASDPPSGASGGRRSITDASSLVSDYQAREKQVAEDEEGWFLSQTVLDGTDYIAEPPEDSDHDANTGEDRKNSSDHKRTSGDSQSPSTHKWSTSIHTSQLRAGNGWKNPRLLWHIVSRAVMGFFDQSFANQNDEKTYQKQLWYSMKTPSRIASGYLVLNWILYLVLNDVTFNDFRKGVYFGGLTFVTVPVFFMVTFDMPASRHLSTRIIFQTWLAVATWYCGIVEIIEMDQCQFSKFGAAGCAGKDFLAMMYYITAVPTLMMFVISKRIYNFFFNILALLLLCVVILPDYPSFSRNVVSYAIFTAFIQWLHYVRDKADRHTFKLQMTIRTAYRNEQKAKMAEAKASEVKQQFSAYIFHEVRVPLNTAVQAFQNLLATGGMNRDHPDADEEIRTIDSGLKMTGQILDDVLDLQRIVTGTFKHSRSAFPLHSVLQSALGLYKSQAAQKGIRLDIKLHKGIDEVYARLQECPEGLWVFSDELRLRQVFVNLMSNALKFTPTNGHIRVTTKLLWSPEDGRELMTDDSPLLKQAKTLKDDVILWRLEVQDSGPGIRPSDLLFSSLFQPFTQTSVGKNSGTGSGLGLAIIKAIVQRFGGRLGITSESGKGATFWIELLYYVAQRPAIDHSRKLLSQPNRYPPTRVPTIFDNEADNSVVQLVAGSTPMSEPPDYFPHSTSSHGHGVPEEDEEEDEEVEPEDQQPLKVLVADDDRTTRMVMQRTLKRMGCEVELVEDGQECVHMVCGHQGQEPKTFDVVFLDNLMPNMTGEDAIRRIRAAGHHDLFVVACTGNALIDDQESFQRAGANFVFTKPIRQDKYEWALDRARELRRKRRHRPPTIPPSSPHVRTTLATDMIVPLDPPPETV